LAATNNIHQKRGQQSSAVMHSIIITENISRPATAAKKATHFVSACFARQGNKNF